MSNLFQITRRSCLVLSLSAIAMPSFALTENSATSLVERALSDVQETIDSGKSGSALYRDFERIFDRYADVPLVAAGSLGIAWRSASDGQKRRYTDAFGGFLSKKYGRRFDEFSGAKFVVTGASETKRGYAVATDVSLPSGSDVEVEWQVRDVKGSPRIFDIVIEGISMLVTERGEIGAMLDARGGDLDKLIADLPNV
ncbi:MAG: ABC transporter substrate-binding protein [Pseudomonadota bacterium]